MLAAMEAMDAVTAKPQSPATRKDGPAELGLPMAGHPLYGQCAKRQSIIEAAETVFAREGFTAASIDTIACAAGVARQTIYNHYRDKETLFAAVVEAMVERANAALYRMIASFPDQPADLAADLAAFSERLIRNGLCNGDCSTLRRLVETEGERHPELFAAWRSQGPNRIAPLIGARLQALALAGHLSIDDPERAARQLVALVQADIQIGALLGEPPTEAGIAAAARSGVATFLKAFGPSHA
jgi:AcrR family transcriptional regulator